jgi:ABC-2 type transport system permease protein
MTKLMLVAVREFLETVKTKAFLFGAVIFPLLMIGLVFMMEKIMKASAKQDAPLRKIAVHDESGHNLLADMLAQAQAYNAENPKRKIEFVQAEQPVEESVAAINRGELYAYIRIPADAVFPVEAEDSSAEAVAGGPASAGAVELGRRDSQMDSKRMLQHMTTAAIVNARYQRHPELDRGLIAQLEAGPRYLDIDTETGVKSEDSGLTRIMTPFAFMFLLWMGTFGISQGLLTSVIEEKGSRVIEVLLSAVSPMQLMAGKILGLVMVGAVLIGIWLAVASASLKSMNIGSIITADRVWYFILYFIPGYLLYASLLGAIGSAFNSLKEAQAMVTPVTLIGVVPMMLWSVLSQYPHGALAVFLSFIPPITPFVMILRLCADSHTPGWQIVATLAVLWVSVIAMMWIAAKIFRVGILMYGKPPTLGELVRWMRYT